MTVMSSGPRRRIETGMHDGCFHIVIGRQMH
jgi:hypothetical protein